MKYVKHMKTTSAFAVIGGILSLMFNACGTQPGEGKEEVSSSNAVPVDGRIIQGEKFNHEFVVAGKLTAEKIVTITAERSRKITSVFVKEGQHVSVGTLLFKLDDADLQAELKQYTLQLRLAQINEKRLKELLQHEAAMQQDYDQISTQVNVLEAQIQKIQSELAKCTIQAPFDGTIGLVDVFKGTFVSPGQPLATLVDSRNMKVDFHIPEKYIGFLKAGTAIQFTVESDTTVYKAAVTAEDAQLDNQTRTLLMRAVFANGTQRVLPGQSAKIFLNLDRHDHAIKVPNASLLASAEGYSVFLVRNGKAHQQAVKLGERQTDNTRILSGVQAGDTLVVSNMLRLAEGTPVQLILSTKTNHN